METSATKNPAPDFHVLIAAAGSGKRLGGELPKQYRKIAGKAILRHTIERFMDCRGMRSLRVIIDPAHNAYYEEAVKDLVLRPPVFGGKERKNSIFNGLRSFSNLKNDEIVLIHDAARPLVGRDEILALVEAMNSNEAATLAVPVVDTLRRAENDDCAGPVVEREGLWAIQTPQAFRYGTILAAHEQAVKQDLQYTDDSALVSASGIDVALIRGHKRNFKITGADDFAMAQILLAPQLEWETRTASGYDVHAFADNGDQVMLGGIAIPAPRTLKGHSDADAGLHAITDALLGTIASGDIGSHFPPADPRWKDADSAIFLRHAVNLIREKQGVIRHIDLTLVCEQPKIGPYRQTMALRIAEICGIDPARVSIKATTTEGLSFTGRGEGIAAQALATIALPMSSEIANV